MDVHRTEVSIFSIQKTLTALFVAEAQREAEALLFLQTRDDDVITKIIRQNWLRHCNFCGSFQKMVVTHTCTHTHTHTKWHTRATLIISTHTHTHKGHFPWHFPSFSQTYRHTHTHTHINMLTHTHTHTHTQSDGILYTHTQQSQRDCLTQHASIFRSIKKRKVS